MSGSLEDWIQGREKAALRRVRLAGSAALALMLCAAAWLGWREAGLRGLPARTGEAVAAQASSETLLRLKQLAHVAYLAKVRQNALLYDLLGQRDLEGLCAGGGDLRGLPDGSPCASGWLGALGTIWTSAHGAEAPPVPGEFKRDGYGSPYLLNQSEFSCGHFGSWCPPDAVRSAGPDGRPGTPDDIQAAVPQHLGPSRIK